MCSTWYEKQKTDSDLLSGRCSARVKEFIFDLSELKVGARGNKGVTVTQYPIRDVKRA